MRKAPRLVVLDAREIEPRRVERRRRERAVTRGQHLARPSRLVPALADRDQRAHEVTDHVVQESVRSELEDDVSAAALDRDRRDVPHRRSRLALARAERAEIVLALE